MPAAKEHRPSHPSGTPLVGMAFRVQLPGRALQRQEIIMARRTATLLIPAGLDRHPVVIKLARILEVDIDCAIGKVVKIIEWCAQHSTDGIVEGAQLEDFEAVARCQLGNAFGTLLERKSVPMRARTGTHEQVQLCVFLECFGKPAKNKTLSARRKSRHAVCIAGARTRAGQPAGLKDKRQIQAGRQTKPVAIGETQRGTQRQPQRSGQDLAPTPDRSPVRPKEIQVQKSQQPAADTAAPEFTVELEDAPPGVPAERMGHWVDYFARTVQMPRPVAEDVLNLPEVTEDRIRWGMERLRDRLMKDRRGEGQKLKLPWKYLEKLLCEGPGQRGTFGPMAPREPRASFESQKQSMLEQARALKHRNAVAAAGGVG